MLHEHDVMCTGEMERHNANENSSKSSFLQQSPLEMMSPDMKAKLTPDFLECVNCFGVSYFLIVTIIIVVVSFSVTLSATCPGDDYWSHFYVALVILFQVCLYFHVLCKHSV